MRSLIFIIIFGGAIGCSSYSSERRDATSPDGRTTSTTRPAASESDVDELKNTSDKPVRLVIYTADLHVSVNNHESALQTATSIAKDAGGFVESSEILQSAAEARITIRVPVARFQETIAAIAKLGTVTDRNVKASDVTKEFLDTENRIQLSHIARDRLYVLLKRVTNLKERVKILKEIDRLTSEIDALTARSTYLKSRGDFSTITITFSSASNQITIKRPSAFKWIRELTHSSRSIFETHGLELPKPPGFFDYSASFYPRWFGLIAGTGDSLFQAPDATIIRAGSTKNYPKGTPTFWQTVVRKELERKGYRILETKDEGRGFLIRAQITENLNIQYYTLFIIVTENWIHVAEAIFPGADTLSHEAEVTTTLRSMKGAD